MDLATHQATDTTHQAADTGHPQRRDFHIANLGLGSVSSLSESASNRVKKWRCGRIVCENGRLTAVCGRWWPHYGSLYQASFEQRFRPLKKDRCEVYYHQSWGSPDYLTLAYARAGSTTTLSTIYIAALALDEIARLKQLSAIVCNVSNQRITERLLQRWGWQQHCLDWPGRHFIKRFYGKYPPLKAHWANRLGAS